MITVAILINGEPLMARSAVNTGERNDKGETLYKVDSGELIAHARHLGAVPLAQKMLDTIQEVIRK
jgi:hypothetical protein